MKILVSLSMMLSLAACAVDSQLIGSAPSTTVQVLVPVRCPAVQEVPTLPLPTPAPAGGMRGKLAALLVDLEALEIYAGRADALLRACASPPEGQP